MSINSDGNLQEQVRQYLAGELGILIEEVTEDLSFGDLPQWDSLGHMTIMAGLEDRFGIEIDADLIAELTSVKGICSYLEGFNHDNQAD